MRVHPVTLTALLLFVSAAPQAQDRSSAEASRLFVQASLSTAGPYGQNWYLTLTPDARLWLEVFFSLDPQGNLVGNFHLSEENMENLREAVRAAEFFSLPEKISPAAAVPLHMPDFRIEVELDGQVRKVSLYSPEHLKGGAEAERFLAVWRQLVAPLPFKPTW